MYIKGEDLKIIRKQAGLTINQAAQLAGVKTRKTIMNWEKNVGAPNINQFLQLCRGYGLNFQELMDDLMHRQNEKERMDSMQSQTTINS